MITGCTSNNNNNSEIKVLDKAPNSLEDVNKEISKILDNIGKIERVNLGLDFEEDEKSTNEHSGDQGELGKKSEQPHTEEEASSQGNDESGNGGSGEGSGEGSSHSHEATQGSTGEADSEKGKVLWTEIDKSLENTYLMWTSYESEGVKKGASKDRITQFQEGLNKLAKSVEEKNIFNIYDFGSQSLLNLKPFYDLYKDDYRGELCNIKYSIYQYYIKATTNDKEGALDEIKSKEENINRIRILIGDDEKKSKELEKISSSLENLGVSIDEESKRVYVLEKDTLIKNLKSLE